VSFGTEKEALLTWSNPPRTMIVMGKRRIVTITDDIDGREGAETVTFAYAGRNYDIDLGAKNKAKLEKALEPFIGAARQAPATRPSARKVGATSSPVDLNAVRAWAVDQGLEVAKRGRLARKVLEAFRQSH
jgi:hypothetical protein